MDSIGDFAEKLINEQVGNIKQGKQLPPSQGSNLTPNGKDISNVTVPDSFMKQVLGESFHPQETPAVEAIPELVWDQPEESIASETLTEETAQQLVPLLEEVKSLLKEMTAAATMSGNIGVNLGGACEDDKSYAEIERQHGYGRQMKGRLGINLPSSRSKLPGDRKSVLKDSIKNRLKKRK